MNDVNKVLDELIVNAEEAKRQILKLWDNSDTSFKFDIDRAERAVEVLGDISDIISDIPLF